jgi:ribonuclease E
MKKEMLINVLQPEECRIAIVEDGVLEELYVERTSHESYVGNIYKGRIVNIDPSIQAAFVDFGVGRNGFLHVSDVEPAYYRHLEQQRGNNGERRGRGRPRPGAPARQVAPAGGRSSESRPARAYRTHEPINPPAPAPEAPPETAPRAEQPELPPTAHLQEEIDFFSSAPPAPEATPVSQQVPTESSQQFEAPPVLPPETPAQETTPEQSAEETAPAVSEAGPRERRRTRGGSRRRREGTAEQQAVTEEPVSETSPAEAAPEAAETSHTEEEHSSPQEPPPPRLMGSAERRTEEGDEEPEAPPSLPVEEDDLLFFPRSEPGSPAASEEHEPAARQTPTAEEESPLEEEDFDEEESPEPELESESEIEPDVDDWEDLAAEMDAAASSSSRRRSSPAREERPAPEDTEEERFAEEMAEDRFHDLEEELDEAPRRSSRHRNGDRDRDRDRRGGGRRRRGSGRPGSQRPKPLIQDIFKRGQEVLVQVIKEGLGTKGPTLSTYISIAGRYLVLMPSLNRLGVSRKIQDDEQRRRLRDILNELQPPKGLGFIIRTAALDRDRPRSTKELQRDLDYLVRLWRVVVKRIGNSKAPAEIYQESDMITRTIRDTFTSDIESIWVDEPNHFQTAQEFLNIVMPRYASRIKLYEGREPLFHKYGLEDEIGRIQQRHVPLPQGGSIVIEQTEAMVAIDVNSGNFRADNNAEETMYQMNLLAAKEIARQLRLRDLGGEIVTDFIDMRDEKHKRGVERALRDALKRDRARTKILKMSAFGIIEMTRQRVRPSLKRSVYQDCPHCLGTGQVKTCESMSIEVMRLLQLAAHRENVRRLQVQVAKDVANYLLNKKRKEITRLEESGGIQVYIEGLQGVAPETLEFFCFDNNGNEMKLPFLPYDEDKPRSPHRR